MLKRTLPLILALCLALTACVSAEIQSTDMLDRAITLQAPASRVVALSAAECEILYALAGRRMVAAGVTATIRRGARRAGFGLGGNTNMRDPGVKPDLV